MSQVLFQTSKIATELRDTLLEHMPSFTKAFNKKDEFETNFTYEPTDTVIDNAIFLRFNTKKFTNILIFDIDEFPSFDFKPSLSTIHQHFYNLTGYEPSWTLTTERGYHIALILDNGIFNTHKDNKTVTNKYQALVKLKQSISKMLDADINASNRTHGIWRNPLTHKNIFTGKKYSLDELLYSLDIPLKKDTASFTTGQLISNNVNLIMRNKKENKILSALSAGFHKGNRNNYLFAYGYKLLFENRDIKDSLESLMHSKNSSSKESLSNYEVKMICKSILKLLPTMYSSNTMKQRGKLSNLMWKLNIHGVSQRRAFSGWYISKQRRTKTLEDITSKMVDSLSSGKSLSQEELAAQVNKSKKTIQRYENKFNLKAMIFKEWHKAYIKRANSNKHLHKIDIRPFVQTRLMESLKEQFLPFFISNTIKESDKVRKTEYLSSLYPLFA